MFIYYTKCFWLIMSEMHLAGGSYSMTYSLHDIPDEKRDAIGILWNQGSSYKWENHLKGDVGVSLHEKGREQEDAYTKTQSHS